MKTVQCLVLLMALAYCAEGRERTKIFKRQAPFRNHKAINQQGVVGQSVIRNTITPQSPSFASPGQASQFNIPLAQGTQRNLQSQSLGYQAQQNQFSQFPQNPPQNQFNQYSTQQAQYQQASPQFAQQQQWGVPSAVRQDVQPQPVRTGYTPASPPPSPSPPGLIYGTVTTPAGTQTIAGSLISNYTTIRPVITEGFSCEGRRYGYYADVANDCQIFHICYDSRSIFNDPSVPFMSIRFSFICPAFTAFAQDSMTCAWAYEVPNCGESEAIANIVNQEFFKTTTAAPPAGAVNVGTAPLPGSVPLTGSYPIG